MSAEQNNAQIARLRSAISDAYAACNEKDATIPSAKIISSLAACIRSIQHGIPEGYVKPTETINISANTTSPMDITNGKWLNVDVQPSSDYIKKADTWNYTTNFAAGTFSKPSDILASNMSINVGFKPKIFVIRIHTPIKSTSSRYYVVTSFMVLDNDYEYQTVMPDGATNTRMGCASCLYLSSSNATSLSTASINNCFSATASGVAGNGSSSSSVYYKANCTYFWYAWG